MSFQYKNGEYAWMIFNDFKIGGEGTGYKLHLGALREVFNMKRNYHEMREFCNGKKFSTIDHGKKDCAKGRQGGWWFYDCAYYCANCMIGVNQDAENKKIAIQEINMAITDI